MEIARLTGGACRIGVTNASLNLAVGLGFALLVILRAVPASCAQRKNLPIPLTDTFSNGWSLYAFSI